MNRVRGGIKSFRQRTISFIFPGPPPAGCGEHRLRVGWAEGSRPPEKVVVVVGGSWGCPTLCLAKADRSTRSHVLGRSPLHSPSRGRAPAAWHRACDKRLPHASRPGRYISTDPVERTVFLFQIADVGTLMSHETAPQRNYRSRTG